MSLHNLLAELQKEYLESLPAKITAINDLIKKGEMELVETEFHKLKGTGRTYGVPEISRVGELGERACWIPDSKRDAAIFQALQLLERVHQTRAKGKDYLIEDDDTCKSLSKLIEQYKFD